MITAIDGITEVLIKRFDGRTLRPMLKLYKAEGGKQTQIKTFELSPNVRIFIGTKSYTPKELEERLENDL